MDNKKKKRNRQGNKPYVNPDTEVLNTEEEKTDNTSEVKAEEKSENSDAKNSDQKNSDTKKTSLKKTDAQQDSTTEETVKSEPEKKESPKREAVRKDGTKRDRQLESVLGKAVTDFSPEHIRDIALNAAKILLPVAAFAIVIAVIISYVGSHKNKAVENASLNVADGSGSAGLMTLSEEPLAENAHADVNDLMNAFYLALADGDMDTIKAVKDYNSDKELITYEEKSKFIESYDNVKCYTKPGVEENSYFVYVTYDVKVKDIETEAPGLNAFYVYTAEDGSLRIDGDTEENIKAAFKLVTNQDDVVDLYNKIDVSYKEAIASDETLNTFMDDLPATIKTSVGEALAHLEAQEGNGETPQTETEAAGAEQTPEAGATENGNEEPLQNQTVNQIVRATDTVNVRSSDSEEADRIGKVQTGTELTRTEDRINGWSKVVFEGREAYIKSDYLEVVATEATSEPIGTVTATTNVNVRSRADQESTKLGTAQAGNSYNLLEEQGEWYKINYNGMTGFVKAEFFDR